MNKLVVKNGGFVNPFRKGDASPSIQVIVTDSGTLSRSYYEGNTLHCWSFDMDYPDENVLIHNKQSQRCMDCAKSIKNAHRGAQCRLFSTIKVVVLGYPELELRLPATSLFGEQGHRLHFYKYVEYLERNRETVGSVLTEIQLVEHYNTHKMYFKPVRSLSERELADVQQLSEAANLTNPFEQKDIDMANYTSHIIRGVVAKYPRLDKPYKYDPKAGVKGKSVPCEATEDGATYSLSFEMQEDQAKELYKLMQTAYAEASGRDKTWPKKLEMPFTQNEDGTFTGKSNFKAAYSGKPTDPPTQYDSKNTVLGEDFMLTSGSTVNIAVEMIPFKMATTGVSLRLRGVQVLEYVPYKPPSPFGEEEGFSNGDQGVKVVNLFEEAEGSFSADDVADDDAAKPVSKRKSKKPQIDDDDDDDIEDIISAWGGGD